MKRSTFTTLSLFCIAGSGADAGAYFAFSTFVMQALKKLPDAAAIPAMQQINIAAENVWFAIALFGTGLVSIVLIVDGLRKPQAKGRVPLFAATILYIASLAVTFGCNVPLNNHLMTVDARSANAGAEWHSFYATWMLWNHTRTLLALASTVLFAVAYKHYRKEEN